MKIEINDNKKIYAIEEEFSRLFPYLRILFPGMKILNGAHPEKTPESNITVGECRKAYGTGVITIVPGMTVNDLVDSFRDIYGLSIKVMRKTGNTWVETSVTRNWSLEQQNNEGYVLSRLRSITGNMDHN